MVESCVNSDVVVCVDVAVAVIVETCRFEDRIIVIKRLVCEVGGYGQFLIAVERNVVNAKESFDFVDEFVGVGRLGARAFFTA